MTFFELINDDRIGIFFCRMTDTVVLLLLNL